MTTSSHPGTLASRDSGEGVELCGSDQAAEDTGDAAAWCSLIDELELMAEDDMFFDDDDVIDASTAQRLRTAAQEASPLVGLALPEIKEATEGYLELLQLAATVMERVAAAGGDYWDYEEALWDEEIYARDDGLELLEATGSVNSFYFETCLDD